MSIAPAVLAALCTSAITGLGHTQTNQRLPHDIIPVVTVPNLDYSALFDVDRTREIAGQGTDKLIYRKLSSFRQLVGVPEFEPTIFWFRHNSPALGCG